MCAIAPVVTASGASAGAGSPDQSFGIGGVASVVPFRTGDSLNRDLLVTPSGAMILATTQTTHSSSDPAVVQFTKSGLLDKRFADGGVFRLGLLSEYGLVTGEVRRIYRLRSRKLLVLGVWQFYHADGDWLENRFMVFRLTARGKLDKFFGRVGIAIVPRRNGTYVNETSALAVLPSGAIAITGSVNQRKMVTRSVATIAMLTKSGKLDRSFGEDGWVELRLGGNRPESGGKDIIYAGRGRLVIAGYASNTRQYHDKALLAQFKTSGAQDRSFGSGGLTLLDPASSSSNKYSNVFHRVMQDPTGRLVAAGAVGAIMPSLGATTTPAIARYSSSGAADTKFGPGGLTVLDGNRDPIEGPDSSTGFTMADDGTGGYLIGAARGAAGWDSRCSVMRTNSSGLQDFAFGFNGDACGGPYWQTNPLLQIGHPYRPGAGPIARDQRGGVVVAALGASTGQYNKRPVNLIRFAP